MSAQGEGADAAAPPGRAPAPPPPPGGQEQVAAPLPADDCCQAQAPAAAAVDGYPTCSSAAMDKGHDAAAKTPLKDPNAQPTAGQCGTDGQLSPAPATQQPPASQPQQTEGEAPQVVLRVEVATKAQAAVLTYSVLILILVFVMAAVAVLVLRQQDVQVGELRPYYLAELVASSVCLAILLGMLGWMAWSVRRSRLEGRRWSARQRYFTGTAMVTLVLQSCYTTCYVAPFVVIQAQQDCAYPWAVISVFDYLKYALFASQMIFILARIKSMTRWRGPGALEMPADRQLFVDRPLRDKATHNRVIIALWVGLLLLGLARLIDRLVKGASGVTSAPGCNVDISTWECTPSGTEIAAAVSLFLILSIYICAWFYYMRRALRDHQQLPYNRYRSTLIFVRVQQRVLSPVLLAVLFSVTALTLVPAFRSSCWGRVDSQMSNLPIFLSLTLSATVLALLYMPKAALDSPLLQEFLQDFSWTVHAMPAALERRCQRLLATEGALQPAPLGSPGPWQPGSQQLLASSTMTRKKLGLAWLASMRGTEVAVDQLGKEPMFCVETAIRLFYWAKLAYQDDASTSSLLEAADYAKSLYNLQYVETVWDDTTDTHCVIGWSDSQVVVSFRGTQSLQNAITDAKTWRKPLEGRSWHGHPLKVHAGFLKAWHQSGFNSRVLQRLREIDRGPTPLRFWITGHSLGGALATLAALDIRQEHANSQLTCYVFGCPRVGNRAFAGQYAEAVPDGWSILNGLDPVPFVPKVGYKSSGKRVTINPRGDLILRPSFFELSVTHRGTSISHHLMLGYALSFAAVLKAQFVESKSLPGGAEGVAALSAAVDVGAALMLTDVRLQDLKDPHVIPQCAENVAAKQQSQLRRSEGSRRAVSSLCGCSPFSQRGAAAKQEVMGRAQPRRADAACSAAEADGQAGKVRQQWRQRQQALQLSPLADPAASTQQAAAVAAVASASAAEGASPAGTEGSQGE